MRIADWGIAERDLKKRAGFAGDFIHRFHRWAQIFEKRTTMGGSMDIQLRRVDCVPGGMQGFIPDTSFSPLWHGQGRLRAWPCVYPVCFLGFSASAQAMLGVAGV